MHFTVVIKPVSVLKIYYYNVTSAGQNVYVSFVIMSNIIYIRERYASEMTKLYTR